MLVSRLVMNLFLQLLAQLCLDEESYTCLASSPMVSKVWLSFLFLSLFFLLVSLFYTYFKSSWQEINLLSAQYIVKVDGKRGLFRGLSPRLVSNAISTVVRSKVKKVSKDWD